MSCSRAWRHLALILGVATLAPARASAGAWVLPAKRAWAQVSFFHQTTEERYFLDGERIPYFFEGRNQTSGLFLDLRYGVLGRLELILQAPVYRVAFDDLADSRRSAGIADVRAGTRFAILNGTNVLTAGVAVKFPTGAFVNDAEVVPVGEGQYDLDLTIEAGRSFWPRQGYVSALLGYRLRGANEKNGIHPGDEFLWLVEAGHKLVSRLSLKLVARGLHGGSSTSFGLDIPTLKREAVYLQPGLVWGVGKERSLELAFPFTVKGRSWPAGLSVGVAFNSRF
jgi:hypothetical protein